MKTKLLVATALFIAPFAFAENNSPHWDYDGSRSGTSHWAELDESFHACKLGKTQSPINIETKKAEKVDLKPITFAYTTGAAQIINNGHTIQVNLPTGGTATIGGVEYQLLQFHFHTPSEEKINGEGYPLVAHLVHKNAEGKLAVIALLFKLGKENTALKSVFNDLPEKVGETRSLEAGINVSNLLPVDLAYYTFMGSLTTPPCSEGVKWQILKTPIEFSIEQFGAFKKLYQMNARPVQPLNGRKVQVGSQ